MYLNQSINGPQSAKAVSLANLAQLSLSFLNGVDALQRRRLRRAVTSVAKLRSQLFGVLPGNRLHASSLASVWEATESPVSL